MDSELAIVIKARDAASAALDKVRGKMSDMSDSMRRAEEGSTMLATGLAAAGAAILGLGTVGVTSAGQFEQSRVAFEVMLGSADRARQMMSDIAEFAKSTPFELPEVVAGSKKLIAYGFAQEQVIDTMRRLGDVSSGVGVNLGELVDIYGKARTQGTLFTEDFDQFTGRGIPMAQALSGVLGVSSDKVRGLASEGKITFAVLQKGFENMTGPSGQFGGMMEKQSRTFSGVMSNIKDGFGQTLRTLVGITSTGDIVKNGLFDKIKGAAEKAMPVVQRLPEILANGFERVKPYLPVITGAIVGGLIPAFGLLAVSIWTATAPLLPWLALGAALGFLLNALAQKMGGWSSLMQKAGEIGGQAWRILKMAIDFLMPSLEALWGTISTKLWPAIQRLWEEISPVLIPILKFLAAVIGVVVVGAIWMAINTINAIINAISWFYQSVANVYGWIRDNWPMLLAILTGPIGLAVFMIIKHWDDIKAALSAAWESIKGVFSVVGGWLSDRFREARDGIKNVFGGIGDFFRGVWDTITGIFGRIGSTMGNAVGNAFKTAVNGILGFLEREVNSIVNVINGALSSIDKITPGSLPRIDKISIPRFDKGVTNFEGGLAYVHQGEVLTNLPRGTSVIPKNEVERMGGAVTNNRTVTIQNISLNSSEAVTRFFELLDSDALLTSKGLTPVQGWS